ncbi:hypothetical protein SUGI_1123110 [Cryptomeria japonica]|nr:hypothetical protein SUGI_1123110 [Cryptomeria japonica]
MKTYAERWTGTGASEQVGAVEPGFRQDDEEAGEGDDGGDDDGVEGVARCLGQLTVCALFRSTIGRVAANDGCGAVGCTAVPVEFKFEDVDDGFSGFYFLSPLVLLSSASLGRRWALSAFFLCREHALAELRVCMVIMVGAIGSECEQTLLSFLVSSLVRVSSAHFSSSFFFVSLAEVGFSPTEVESLLVCRGLSG